MATPGPDSLVFGRSGPEKPCKKPGIFARKSRFRSDEGSISDREALGGGTEAFARFNRRQLVLPGSTDMVPFGHSWRIGRSDFDRFWAFKLTTDKFTFLVQTWRLSRLFFNWGYLPAEDAGV